MSFLDKIKNRVETVANGALAATNIPLTSIEIRLNRIEQCDNCEYLFKPTRSCKKCGCFVDAKARLQNATCPVNKW